MRALITGLRTAGANRSQQSAMMVLRAAHDFAADDQVANAPIDISNLAQLSTGACANGYPLAATLVEGNKVAPVSGTPLCRHTVPGLRTK